MSDNDWLDSPNWHDANEAVDPGGAAGPGAIGPVPATLINNTAAAGPGAIGDLAPVSNTTTNQDSAAGSPGDATGAPFKVNYSELEKFAQEHDLNAEELTQWASGDPDFAERYLATHGKVNFGTYLKIKEFMASKQIAGTTFAAYNTQTATALRASIAMTKAQEEANAAAIDATRMV
jgi:hypothetical protein